MMIKIILIFGFVDGSLKKKISLKLSVNEIYGYRNNENVMLREFVTYGFKKYH